MKRDVASGSLLIAGAGAGVLVMLLHPTAHGLMDPETGARVARMNAFVHGLALAAPGVIERIVAKDGSKIPDAFLLYTALWNRAFAKVNLVASSLAIVLFSVSIFRTRRLSPAAGVAGAIGGALIVLLFFAGHISIDVHGFGIVIFAQSAWLVWVGVLLTLNPRPATRDSQLCAFAASFATVAAPRNVTRAFVARSNTVFENFDSPCLTLQSQ